MSGTRVVLCPHLSVEHYRGGEKWVCSLANRLNADGVDVSVRALPYAPGGERRVEVRDVLDPDIPYREAWHHDLSAFDTAYIFYNPLSELFFSGGGTRIAGVHSWVFVSRKLYEAHYGTVPTAVKLLYRTLGKRDLSRFDVVHSVTPAYDSPHPNTVHIPNFVDTDQFNARQRTARRRVYCTYHRRPHPREGLGYDPGRRRASPGRRSRGDDRRGRGPGRRPRVP